MQKSSNRGLTARRPIRTGWTLVLAASLLSLVGILGRPPAWAGAVTPPGVFELPVGEDSTELVDIGFTINVYAGGDPYHFSKLYVNRDGSVTFFSPDDTSPGYTFCNQAPIIAPFWADVDTDAPGTITYGPTTYDSRPAFVVTWDSVGIPGGDTAQTNTFQLLLVDRSIDSGIPGDFDIVFNYDQIWWECTDSLDGLCDYIPPSAGFEFFTGEVLLPGSPYCHSEPDGAVFGGFLDSNLVTGLVNNQRRSGVPGRYVFEFRELIHPHTGRIEGYVEDDSGSSVQGCVVTASGSGPGDPPPSLATMTDEYGFYFLTGLEEANYTVTATPPLGSGLGPDSQGVPSDPNLDEFVDFVLTEAVDSDTDGDGLLDDWELNGYTHDNGEFVNLPAMGADPDRKDVFVEIDYMAGLAPQQAALDIVIEAFANAPVSNPDGSTGITLHVIMEDDPLTHVTTLGTLDSGEYLWTPPTGSSVTHFDDLKTLNFLEEREWAVHYCIWADKLPGRYSGMSRGAPASDFIVALGDLTAEAGLSQSEVRWEAGTFMHELGHNLGLEHGGGADDPNHEINYKPNYLSIMSYTFQLDGLQMIDGDGVVSFEHFDYSRSELDALDEGDLDESFGLTPLAGATGYGTVWWWPEWNERFEVYEQVRHDALDATAAINWRWSEDDVPQSINQDEDTETLKGHDDWSNLIYTGGRLGSGVPVPLPTSTEADEMDVETAQAVWRLPWPVTKLKGHVTKKRFDLTWKPAGSAQEVAAYRIYRDGRHIGTSLTSNYKDDAVEPKATHSYYVTWLNPRGQESVPSEAVQLSMK